MAASVTECMSYAMNTKQGGVTHDYILTGQIKYVALPP